MDLFGGHRLGFCQTANLVLLQDGENRLTGVLVGFGEVDVHAALGQRVFGLGQIVTEVVERVVLDGTRQAPQRVGLGVVLMQHLVAFFGACRRSVEHRGLLFVCNLACVVVNELGTEHGMAGRSREADGKNGSYLSTFSPSFLSLGSMTNWQ